MLSFFHCKGPSDMYGMTNDMPYRSKLVRLPTNVFGYCHHLVNDGLDLLLKIKKKVTFMAAKWQKMWWEKKTYIVVQKAITIRIVQPKHNWKVKEGYIKDWKYFSALLLLRMSDFSCFCSSRTSDEKIAMQIWQPIVWQKGRRRGGGGRKTKCVCLFFKLASHEICSSFAIQKDDFDVVISS